MDNNSASGGQMRFSRDSELDFVNYWADQTVEDAIRRGTQLRQEKTRQEMPQTKLDVVDIDYIKPPRSSKNSGSRRKKSSKKKPHRSRSCSPLCSGNSPPRSTRTAKRKKSRKTKVLCGMRIAELAVPTKRQCLDTWRSKCNTLPAYMIERLRQHVLDQRPIVQISDAIYCFKKKCKRGINNDKPVDNTCERCNTKIKKPLRANEVKTLCAIFGHKIAKKLNRPLNIILTADLQKVANVVSNDILDMLSKPKKIDMNNDKNRSIHLEMSKKVTYWISDVLQESTYKILEDQLEDFEEEAGPALDFIDDLVDSVLDICVPEPEVFEVPSICGTEEPGLEEVGLEEAEDIQIDIDYGASPETEDYETITDHFKKEIGTIIDNIETDISDAKSDEYVDVDDGTNLQPSEAADEQVEETVEEPVEEATDEPVEETVAEPVGESVEETVAEPVEEQTEEPVEEPAEEPETDINNEEFKESEEGAAKQPSGDAEVKDSDIETGGNLESEDVVVLPPSDITEIPEENIDDGKDVEGTETFDDAIDGDKDEDNLPESRPSETLTDESDKKVTFTEGDEEGNADPKIEEVGDLEWKPSLDQIDFAEPNDDLLSDADELWPAAMLPPPLLRPSQSVSKSMSSLGKISEDEEKASLQPEDKTNRLGQEGDTNFYPLPEPENQEQDNVIPTPDEGTKTDDAEGKIDEQIPKEETEKSTETKEEEIKSKDEAEKTKEKAVKSKEDKKQKKPPIKEGRTSGGKLDKSSDIKTKRPSKAIEITIERIPSKRKPVPKMNKLAAKRKEKTPISKLKSKETTATSQSVKDLGDTDVEKAKDVKFSSLRVKKPDYRVNAQTAPAWVTRNYGEPSCTCINIAASASKEQLTRKINKNDIRRWCRDLEQGYENLKMWNEWVENTSKTVCILQQEIGGLVCPALCTNKDVREWSKLKRNIDKDASVWRKLNQSTRERLKCYKKIYHKRSEV